MELGQNKPASSGYQSISEYLRIVWTCGERGIRRMAATAIQPEFVRQEKERDTILLLPGRSVDSHAQRGGYKAHEHMGWTYRGHEERYATPFLAGGIGVAAFVEVANRLRAASIMHLHASEERNLANEVSRILGLKDYDRPSKASIAILAPGKLTSKTSGESKMEPSNEWLASELNKLAIHESDGRGLDVQLHLYDNGLLSSFPGQGALLLDLPSDSGPRIFVENKQVLPV